MGHGAAEPSDWYLDCKPESQCLIRVHSGVRYMRYKFLWHSDIVDPIK